MRLPRNFFAFLLLFSLQPVYAENEERDVDPLEPLNRQLFLLNDVLDKYLVKPVARGYQYVTPDIVERGVGNFFANMYDATSAVNAALQWKWVGAAQSGGRFLVNSTLGIAGVFDVATPLGIRPYRADFGQTLAVWGFDAGPYLMVPLFGPRTVRSGVGTLVDLYTSVPTYIDSETVRYSIWGLEIVDTRARLLQAEELISGDRYIFVRDAYLQQREYFINDGEVTDNFSNFEEGDDWEEF
jgi:phospholipid-binding lipoprotein MlaA